jgi:formylglycine-generating enzyme required for sulfatase activity
LADVWNDIETNKERAARRDRLLLMAREWKDRRGLARMLGLAGSSSLFELRGLATKGSLEQHYLRWSRARVAVEASALAAMLLVIGESVSWVVDRGAPLAAVGERWAYTLGLAKPPVPKLVEIPAGSFQMGSDKESFSKPVHPVTFTQPFSLAATEITFREWDACVADGGCDYRPPDQGLGSRHATGDQRLVAGCAGLYQVVESQDGEGLSAAERGRVGIRRSRRHHD